MRRRRGFTLWEMAMVLAILAILTTLAVPAFAKFGADKKRTSTDLVVNLINDSRRVAIRNNVMATLILDPENGHYRLDTTGATGAGLFAEDSLKLAINEKLETELPRLRYLFRPTGAAFGDTVLVRSTDSTRAIIVDRLSGVAHAYGR